MRSAKLTFIAAVFFIGLNAGASYAASAGSAGFERRKAQQLNRLENPHQQLDDKKVCISRATTADAMKTRRERFKSTRKSGRLS